MEKILEAIRFYQKQEKDLIKACIQNVEKFPSATTARRRNLRDRISICAEAKEKAFWYVVETIKKSELGPILAQITEEDLRKIKSFNGRYLPVAQAAEMSFRKIEERK